MTLADILNENAIEVSLKAKDKKEALLEMVNLLEQGWGIKNKEDILKSINSREELMSTGIGHGVAIPHARSNSVTKVLAAFGKSEKGVDFNALDKKPVYLLFLLIASEDASNAHIKILARVSRLLKHNYFRELLKNAETPQEILSLIKKEESKHL
ncbi:MAG: PTS sugar transporter subunit IIA [bacterium]|nr:PTS sugar transporter subunit IIA [bacterium]